MGTCNGNVTVCAPSSQTSPGQAIGSDDEWYPRDTFSFFKTENVIFVPSIYGATKLTIPTTRVVFRRCNDIFKSPPGTRTANVGTIIGTVCRVFGTI